mgnify:CR=1 FL=1
MIYKEQVNKQMGDDVVKVKVKPDKTLEPKDYKNISEQFMLYKNLNKNDKVIGWLGTNYFPEEQFNENDSQFINRNFMYGNSYNSYIEVYPKKKGFTRKVGYAYVGDDQYIGITKSIIPIFFWLFFIGLLLIGVLFLSLYIWDKLTPNGNISVSDDTVDLEAIRLYEDQSFQSMVYVSGQAVTTISEDYPNVYLQNNRENEGLVLQYDVFLDGNEEPIYKSGNIPCGKAESWKAYNNPELSYGENKIRWVVTVYDENGMVTAKTNVNGLTIIKR